MKDFLKWLGVNEKVAKIAVWFLIFMVFLVMTNKMLESVGFPNYTITVNNIVKISSSKWGNCIFSWIICVLNFYSIVLLVFRIRDTKKIFKYSLIYLVLAVIINKLTNYAFSQIFILIYVLIFCFIFSNKNWKYLIYGLISLFISTIIQYVCYFYKVRLIDLTTLNQATKMVLSLDYFIVMGIIILVKEIYLKKRSER